MINFFFSVIARHTKTSLLNFFSVKASSNPYSSKLFLPTNETPNNVFAPANLGCDESTHHCLHVASQTSNAPHHQNCFI